MITRRKLLKGSVSEKFDQLEKLIWHLRIRRGDYVIGLTPPIPVFDFTDTPNSAGVVFRKIIPADGMITVGCMWVEDFDKKQNPMAILIIEDHQGSSSVNVPIDRQALSIRPQMPVKFGQRITLKISPAESCKGIWTAFLFEVEQDELAVNRQLMKGFLELAELGVEELDDA